MNNNLGMLMLGLLVGVALGFFAGYKYCEYHAIKELENKFHIETPHFKMNGWQK